MASTSRSARHKQTTAASLLQAKLQRTPDTLVSGGRFNLGIYAAPFMSVNPLDADLAPVPVPRGLKNLTLKEWQHFALGNARVYMSVALFDTKRLSLAHVVIYDRQTKRKVEYETKFPSWHIAVAQSEWHGKTEVSRGGLHIVVENDLEAGCHRIRINCAARGRLPPVQAAFVCHEPLDTVQPIVVCLPLGKHRAMYSHKAVMPLEGELRVDYETHRFARADSFAIADIHKGYYPYVMKWHWSTGAGVDRAGRLVGFNFTDNQVEDQETYNENCLWVDGKLHLLPPVTFSFDPERWQAPWRVRDRYGRVDVRFQPEVERNIDVNAFVVRSRYRGPYGAFTGHIVDSSGERVSVDHCFGMAENFYLRG